MPAPTHLGTRQAHAPHYAQPILKQLLDELKALEVKQHHQAVLNLTRVWQLQAGQITRGSSSRGRQ